MRRGLKNVSLSTRAALLVCTCVAMFFAGLLYLTVRYIERQFMDMLGQHQFTMVGIQAEDLDIKLRTMHETLTAIAKRVTTRTLRRADAAQIFLDDRVFLHRSFDNGIFLVGMDGVIVADSPYKPGRRGFNSAFREFTQVTIQTKKPYISKPYVSMNSPGEPVIMMTAPTFDASGRMNGMLMGSFALLGKNFLSDLSKRRIGRGGYFFLTDRERTMLMFPDRERVMKVAAKPGQNRVYDMAIGGFEGTGETVTSVGLPVLMSVKRLQTVDWLLGASFPLTEVKEPLVQMLRYVLAGTAVALLALMLAVIWLMRRLLRPVSLLTERVRSVAQNERQPITMHAPGELGVLIDSFNEMLLALTRSEAAQRRIEEDIRTLNASLENRVSDRTAKLAAANAELAGALQRLERAQDGLIRSEKLAALGSLVAGVAHELNTPLGNALMVASTLQEKNSAFVREVESGMLRRSILDEYTRANAEASTLIMRSVWQAAELISNFKQVAVDQTSAKRRAFDLKEVIEEVLSTLQHLVKHKPIEVRAQLAEGIRMDSYPGPLGQVLTNFYTNALAHAFEGRAAGVIEIRTRAEGADEVVLEFRDDGNGIPEEHLKKIFDPFFTTKLGQGGSGLGLSIAHNIVTGMLGGRIEMESRPGAGTRFTVVLPVAAPGFDRSNLMSIGVERPAQSGRSAVG